MLADAGRVAEVMGGPGTLRREVRSTADLVELIEQGIPVEALDAVMGRIELNGSLAGDVKHWVVPKSTLTRRHDRLNLEESERLERLARVTALAEQVWEDRRLAREFLTAPQPQLDDARPIDAIRTELGSRRVEELLLRLEYSLPA
jgi:putative toxin-antitoxin system antitoxin component (TIGR02293 family)